MINKLYQKHKSVIIFSIILTVIFLLIFSSYIEIPVNFKKLFYYIVYPFHRLRFTVSDYIDKNIETIKKMDELRRELTDTKEKLNVYESLTIELIRLREENRRLKAVIEYEKKSSYPSLFASVIAKDPQNFYKTIVINKGTKHGVKKDMPVISYQHNEKALIGKIIDVSEIASKVITILDSQCSVCVMIERNRIIGISKGEIPKNYFLCIVEYLDRSQEIMMHDRVITSGLGGIYPGNIYIGEIIDIDKKNYGLFQNAYIDPHINFSQLEDVYIILKETETWLSD
ncbi:rod shape-determining protein MreC [Spirochaetota bacterium]